MERPLWREVGSLVFSCCWVSPAQSLSALSPAEHMAIFYCSNLLDCPNLEGQIAVFVSSRYGVAQLYPQALGS
jgi:hypothetical protein